MGDQKSVIEKFEGRDFGFWRMQIEDVLHSRDLEAALTEKPEEMSDADYSKIDRKALSAVRLSLTRDVAFHVAQAESTVEVLDILAKMYEQPSAANKVHLMRKLFNLKMSESSSVASHLNEFNQVTSQLSSVKIDFDDEVKALILLSSLPESWDPIVAGVSASSGKKKLKFANIRDLILNEEIRRKENGTHTGSALNTEQRGRSDTRWKGRGKSRSKSRPRGKKDHSNVVCWNCDKAGHFKSQCREPKKEKDSVNSAKEIQDYSDALVLSVCSPLESWVMDSGASFHSCSNSAVMESYIPGNFGLVYLADDEPLKIVGKGSVRISLPSGSEWRLNNVRHVPGLKRNLISVGQLDDEGYTTAFGGNTWKVSKGAMVVARGTKDGTLYMTNNRRDCIGAVASNDNADLWHCCLGHMSEKGMKEMVAKGKVPNLKSVELGLCEDCIFGKQKKVTFLKGGRDLRKQKLELVHSDLWGPAPVASLGGSQYYMTFIDDATRKVWVYFLKRKSDAFDAFRKWKARVENETGLRVKCLRSDNGGEYELIEFKKYCAENGIRMEKTVPGTPQQNGVAERMDRMLNERARC